MKTDQPQYTIILCTEDMLSDGRKYPSDGFIESRGWYPAPVYENGLHGLLWRPGVWWQSFEWPELTKWLVVRTEGPVVETPLGLKFKQGYVEHCGTRKSATEYFIEKSPEELKQTLVPVSLENLNMEKLLDTLF